MCIDCFADAVNILIRNMFASIHAVPNVSPAVVFRPKIAMIETHSGRNPVGIQKLRGDLRYGDLSCTFRAIARLLLVGISPFPPFLLVELKPPTCEKGKLSDEVLLWMLAFEDTLKERST